eukprot:3987010-Amphidinium_carterae.1
MPWSTLGCYLELLEKEFTFSVLALQEIHDDGDELVNDGWWNVGGHRVLISHSYNRSVFGLVFHRDYVANAVMEAHTTQFT